MIAARLLHLEKISHGFYPEIVEGFEMTGLGFRCHSEQDARNLFPTHDSGIQMHYYRRSVEISGTGGLIILAKLSRTLVTSVLLCFVGLTILSNRVFVLRQLRASPNHSAAFDLSVDTGNASHSGKRLFLIATPNEGLSDLQQLSRDHIGNKTHPGSPQDSRDYFAFPNLLSASSPVYIFQSALNL